MTSKEGNGLPGVQLGAAPPADGEGRSDDERFRALIECVPAVVYEAEPGRHGRWLYVSPQIEDLLGYSPEEWTADPELFVRRIHPDDREAVVELERREVELARDEEGVVVVGEYRMLHRHGHVVHVSDEARLTRMADGQLCWRGLIAEISAERQAEHALAETLRLYRSLVEGLPVCVYRLDPHPGGGWELVSPQIESILGYGADEWLADPNLWSAALHPDDREWVQRARLDNAAGQVGSQWTGEYRLVHRSGKSVWVRDRAVTTRAADGRHLLDGMLTDITEERAVGSGEISDVYRLTCSSCGAVWAAEQVEACPTCGAGAPRVVSLNSALADLGRARAQVERLLDGVHHHLDVLGRSLGSVREEHRLPATQTRHRRVIARIDGDADPFP